MNIRLTNRKQAIYWTLTVLLLAGLFACSKQDRPYTHALDGAPTSLDPAHASNEYAGFLVSNLFDTLYRYRYFARPYEATPNLATALPDISEDGLVYRIKIRRGVRFIDDAAFADGIGREVTAHDVVYSLLRHFDPVTESRGAWLWRDHIVGVQVWAESGADYDKPPEGLRAINDYLVEIQLNRPFPQFILTLTNPMSAIVAREVVNTYGTAIGAHPVGSGPYQLMEFNAAEALLQRHPEFREDRFDLDNEGYVQGVHDGRYESLQGHAVPFEDIVNVVFMPDDNARRLTMGRDIDFSRLGSTFVNAQTKPDIWHTMSRTQVNQLGTVYLAMNQLDPAIGVNPDPVQNERNRQLRCAIAEAWGWDRRNEIFYGGGATILNTIFPPGLREFQTRQRPAQDFERARQRLTEFGWMPESLPVLEFAGLAGVAYQQQFEEFRSNLQSIGYPVDKITMKQYASFGELSRATTKGKAQLFIHAWNLDYPDAENIALLFYGPNKAPGANKTNFQNPEFDSLFEQARYMSPSPARDALYTQMEDILIKECVGSFGISRSRVYLAGPDILIQPDPLLSGQVLRFAARHHTD